MLSSSLEAKENQNLLSGLRASEFVLALGNTLGLGSVLGRSAVRKLRGPDQGLEALRLQDLDRLKILRSLELSRGHLAQEPPGALLILKLGDGLKQRNLGNLNWLIKKSNIIISLNVHLISRSLAPGGSDESGSLQLEEAQSGDGGGGGGGDGDGGEGDASDGGHGQGDSPPHSGVLLRLPPLPGGGQDSGCLELQKPEGPEGGGEVRRDYDGGDRNRHGAGDSRDTGEESAGEKNRIHNERGATCLPRLPTETDLHR